jgi:hypothetical protein
MALTLTGVCFAADGLATQTLEAGQSYSSLQPGSLASGNVKHAVQCADGVTLDKAGPNNLSKKQGTVEFGGIVNKTAQSGKELATIQKPARESCLEANAVKIPELSNDRVTQYRNPDGSITAVIKGNMDSVRGTGTCDDTPIWTMSPATDPVNYGSYRGYVGHAVGYGEFRGNIAFDTSWIPDTATVSDVDIDIWVDTFYTFSSNDMQFDIYDCFYEYPWSDPAVLGELTLLWTDCGNGTMYDSSPVYPYPYTVKNWTSFGLTGGSNQVVTDFQAALTSTDFFALGLDYNDAYTNNVWTYDTEGEDCPGDPRLYVTYDVPGEDAVTITNITATPASVANIGPALCTIDVYFTDLDEADITSFSYIMRLQKDGYYWSLSGFVGEHLGSGDYHMYGTFEWPDNMEAGDYDAFLFLSDGSFQDISYYDENAAVMTVTSPATGTLYEDFNATGGAGWPTGWTADYVDDDNGWQDSYIWLNGDTTQTQNYLAYCHSTTQAGIYNLTTPVIDCSTATSVHLFEMVGWDGTVAEATLTYSLNGTLWQVAYDYAANLTPGSVYLVNHNLSTEIAGASTVQLRWHLNAPAGDGNMSVDVIQLVFNDNAPTMGTGVISVAPGAVEVLSSNTVTFTVPFTGDAAKTVDDYLVSIFVGSDTDTMWYAMDEGINYYTDVTITKAGADYTATVLYDPPPSVEIGDFDLAAIVSDGIDSAVDDFADNEDELTITTAAFYYEDFNDIVPPALPTGWTTFDYAGHTGDPWITGPWFAPPATNYMAYIAYDLQMDRQHQGLRTGTIDCSAQSDVYFYAYTEWYTGYDPNAIGQLRVSVDGGSNWDVLYDYPQEIAPAGYYVIFAYDVSSYVDGESNVMFEFYYDATDDDVWIVDTIHVASNPNTVLPATGPLGLGILIFAISGLLGFRTLKRKK